MQGVTEKTSLQMIGVELLEDLSGTGDPWVAHLNNIHCKPTEEHILTSVKELIEQNAYLFQELKKLPPKRAYDHRITLRAYA